VRTIVALIVLISQAPAAQLSVQDYEALEKKIGATYPAFQTHLKLQETQDAVKKAEELAVIFGDIERFWAQSNKTDAAKWAQDGRTFATQTAGAATAGDSAAATKAAAGIERTCTQCHAKYREQDAAGNFRIKTGALTPIKQ
jgi:cytochrome c553